MVLAAGGASRMGQPKQLILHDGQPLVARAVNAARDAGASSVVVVLGANAAEVRRKVPAGDGIEVTVNSEWKSGLASSLKAGLAALEREEWDAVLLTVADQPLVDGAVLRLLVDAHRGGARLVAADYGGSPGVPALISREHAGDLRSLTGDNGAGPWLRARLDAVTLVSLPEALLDVDTPSDVTRLADRARSR